MSKPRSFWDKLWKDEHGKWTIWQSPNIPLATWFVAMLATHIFRSGWSNRLFDVIGFGALFTWAYLEIRFGDSYFRRLLGVAVILVIVVNRIG